MKVYKTTVGTYIITVGNTILPYYDIETRLKDRAILLTVEQETSLYRKFSDIQ